MLLFILSIDKVYTVKLEIRKNQVKHSDSITTCKADMPAVCCGSEGEREDEAAALDHNGVRTLYYKN